MTERITALIIDDEERARNSILAALQSFCPEVEVLGTASNVMDGAAFIRAHHPQLVFLDIEMPQYNGFELFSFVEEETFDVIFITAYSKYAIQAFEVSAIDYLLKPLDIDALQQAVQKAAEKHQLFNLQQRLEVLKDSFIHEEIRKIALPMADGLLFVEIKDIVLFEADGAYTHVCLNNGSKILVSKKLKFFEELVSNRPNFFRPHRSHMINLNYLKKYIRGENNLIMDNNQHISLSRDLKQDFERLLKELRLG